MPPFCFSVGVFARIDFAAPTRQALPDLRRSPAADRLVCRFALRRNPLQLLR